MGSHELPTSLGFFFLQNWPKFPIGQKKINNFFIKSVGNVKVFLKVPPLNWSESSCR